MAKFFRLMVIIIAALAMSISVALLIGIARPIQNPVSSFGLARCMDDLPCFRGVTPGRTRWSEAQAAFASLGNTDLSGPKTTIILGSYGNVVYSRSVDQTAF